MEFKIKGTTYTAGKLNAVAQFHIVRRILPVFSGLADIQGDIKSAKTSEDREAAVFEKILPPVFDAFSKMTDDEFETVLYGLLAAIKKKEPGDCGYSPVTNGKSLMYDDLTMPDLVQMAAKAFQANLSDFFQGLPSDLNEALSKQSGPQNG